MNRVIVPLSGTVSGGTPIEPIMIPRVDTFSVKYVNEVSIATLKNVESLVS